MALGLGTVDAGSGFVKASDWTDIPVSVLSIRRSGLLMKEPQLDNNNFICM